MEFAFYFFISWLIVIIFAVMKKTLSLLENTFVYLLILIVSINWTWIIYEEMKLVELSKQVLDYTAFLINRSIAVPLIVVVALNIIRRVNSLGKRILTVLLSVALLVILAVIGRFSGITEYTNWNFDYDTLYFLSLHIVAYLALKVFQRTKRSEVMGT